MLPLEIATADALTSGSTAASPVTEAEEEADTQEQQPPPLQHQQQQQQQFSPLTEVAPLNVQGTHFLHKSYILGKKRSRVFWHVSV